MSKENKPVNDMESLVSSMNNLHIEPPPEGSSSSSSQPPCSSVSVSIQWRAMDNETDLISGAYVRGFVPLTYKMMIETPIAQLESMIRVRLTTLIHSMYPQVSDRIASILMSAGIWDCYYMLQNPPYFKAVVEHIVAQLSAD